MEIVVKRYFIKLLELNDKKEAHAKEVLKYHADIEKGHELFLDNLMKNNFENLSDTYILSVRGEYVLSFNANRLFNAEYQFELTPAKLDLLRKLLAENDIKYVDSVVRDEQAVLAESRKINEDYLKENNSEKG